MLLLALDTSAAVSAAVHDGTSVLAEVLTFDPRRHAELLVPAIEQVLEQAGAARTDLTGVVVGTGPGPFTGLRVALVTGRTLGLALGLPVHGICSLDALALEASDRLGPGSGDLLVATDARRKEVYWSRYAAPVAGVPVRSAGPQVSRPADVPVSGALCVGRGAATYPDDLPGPADGLPLDPGAGALSRIAVAAQSAGREPLGPPEPLYLRRPDAVEPSARKRVL